jgi:hypothetical protein
MRRLLALFVFLAAACAAGPASAVACFTLMNKSDEVIYRGYDSPVDLSVAGAAEREAMRSRGEYLIISYPDDCLLVSASRWTTGGYGPASVEDIVSEMRPFASGAPSGTPTSFGGAITSPLPPSQAPITSGGPTGVRSGSTGMRGGY